MSVEEWKAALLAAVARSQRPVQVAAMAGAAVLLAAHGLAADGKVLCAPVPHRGGNEVVKLWKEA